MSNFGFGRQGLLGGSSNTSEDGDKLIAFVEQQFHLIGVAYHRFLEKFDLVQGFGCFFLDYRDFMYEIPARFCAVRFAIIRSN